MDMGFERATMQQAALKVALYGAPGSGKTYTALSVASGIGGRIAVIDTEHGSDFYANRWAFDVLHTRSVVEIKAELPAYLDANPDVSAFPLLHSSIHKQACGSERPPQAHSKTETAFRDVLHCEH